MTGDRALRGGQVENMSYIGGVDANRWFDLKLLTMIEARMDNERIGACTDDVDHNEQE